MGLQINTLISSTGLLKTPRGLGAPYAETLLFVQPDTPSTASLVDLSPTSRTLVGTFENISSLSANPRWVGRYFLPSSVNGDVEVNVVTSPSDFQLGTSNFTIEMVVHDIEPNSDGTGRICGSDRGGEAGGWHVSFAGVNSQPNGVTVNGLFTIPFDFLPQTRYHVALCRDANVFTLFVNGTSVGSETNAVSLTGVPTNFRCFHRADIYNLYNNQLVANIESFRIIKDVALYGSNFVADISRPMYLY